MNTMLERMARRAVDRNGSWDGAPVEVRREVLATMRAVLETLREPTPGMIAIGSEAEDAAGEPVGEIGAGAVWSAMIEEALR